MKLTNRQKLALELLGKNANLDTFKDALPKYSEFSDKYHRLEHSLECGGGDKYLRERIAVALQCGIDLDIDMDDEDLFLSYEGVRLKDLVEYSGLTKYPYGFKFTMQQKGFCVIVKDEVDEALKTTIEKQLSLYFSETVRDSALKKVVLEGMGGIVENYIAAADLTPAKVFGKTAQMAEVEVYRQTFCVFY